MAAARSIMPALWINGQEFDVAPEAANIPLAVFIKTMTPFKSVKIACGEGGCGACTVAVEGKQDGQPHLRTLNSCLAPVYSLLGRSLLTAEGLPTTAPYGTSLVAERLSEYHASQCGYCTPGFTVACHAALHNAAATANTNTTAATGDTTTAAATPAAAAPAGLCQGPSSDVCTTDGAQGPYSNDQGGGSDGSCAGAGGGGGGRGGCSLLNEGPLLRALDGNLCRCTGYRPIVAACRSLAAEVADIEDLHCRRRTAGADGAWCDGGSVTVSAGPRRAAFLEGSTGPTIAELALGPRQVLKVPRSLEQLVSEVGRLAASDSPSSSSSSWRLVAGHTGHGVFKDWPLREEVLIAVTEVPELLRLELVAAGNGGGDGLGGTEAPSLQGNPRQLHIGACITLERLAARLDAMAQQAVAPDGAIVPGVAAAAVDGGSTGAEGGKGAFGVRRWAAETSAHLYRVAGRHVRNSATVGGNLVLARERSLPSDVATVLAAAGAEVEVVVVSADSATHGSVLRADLLQFVTGAAPTLPTGASYILTAVRVPLPPADPRVRFWSQRIAERYSNAAAVANAAILVRLSAPPALSTSPTTLSCESSPADGDATVAVVDVVRIVVGLRIPPGGAITAVDRDRVDDGTAAATMCSASEHNSRKLNDPTVVLLDGWQCFRAVGTEAALRDRPAIAATVVAAIEALAVSDMVAAAAAAALSGNEKAAAAIAIAQGLVAQGLVACMGLSAAPRTVEDSAAMVAATADVNKPKDDTVVDAGCVGTDGDGCGNVNGVNGAAKAVVQECAVREGRVDGAANGHTTANGLSPQPARMPQPSLVDGRHFLPEPVSELRPVTQAVPKMGSNLQASGTALYTEDVPVHRGALYGAFVLTARVGGRLADVDTYPALLLPGVVRFLGAADLPMVGPAGARNTCKQFISGLAPEMTFLEVGARCEFAGQLVGIILANSPWAAQNGARAVRLKYGKSCRGDGATDNTPLLTIADAVRAGSFYKLPALVPVAPSGRTYGDGNSFLAKGGADVDQILAAAEASTAAALTATALGVAGGGADALPPPELPRPSTFRVVSGRYGTPSQLHFYMETQSAVAWPDEDGCVVVQSSCQGPDFVQNGVATALQLPLNKVLVRCRRLGGGFGGKLTFARRVAVVAAIAAVATGRQVRISVPRNTDLVMWGGRCDADVSYVAVLDDSPTEDGDASTAASHNPQRQQRRQLPRMRALDVHVLLLGGAFLDISIADPLSLIAAIDSVYDIPAFRLEVALTRCNLPPRTTVRGPGEITATMIIEQILEHVAAELGVDPEALREAHFIKAPPSPTSASQPYNDTAAIAQAASVTTALGKTIPLRLYSLPYMWTRLQQEANFERIKADVARFNATNPWRKRGVAVIPSRYTMYRGRKPAYVSLLQDGTALVACHGVEMGQGLWTKVAQVAALTLSEVLPPSRQPMDPSFIRIADNSTELLPNSGFTSSSTSSELACAAVRLACLQLVKNLREYALPKMIGKQDFGLRDLVAAVVEPPGVMAPLSAFAWGGQPDLPEARTADTFFGGTADPVPVDPQYHVLGVALAVVELDVLTGDRRVLRSDIMFDLGRPMNPAVDLGQVEGAFVQGLGMMLQEEVTYDGTTGALVQNSTWSYKPPSVSCVPQQLNVYLLNDAPLASGGPVSSKACGEPALLLSTAVLAALQRATAAARGIGSEGGGREEGVFVPLLAPATVERLRLACGGTDSTVEMLRRGML